LDLLNRYVIVSKAKISRYVFYDGTNSFILDKSEETTQNFKGFMQITKPEKVTKRESL
jgi:hypothetical protein